MRRDAKTRFAEPAFLPCGGPVLDAVQGPENLVVNTATVAKTLGRPLSGGASSVTVNLVEPQTLVGDRITQVDFRVAKILRYGRTRAQIGVDIFNLMNSNVAQGYLQTFGSTWLRPTSVMDARFARVSGQIDF